MIDGIQQGRLVETVDVLEIQQNLWSPEGISQLQQCDGQIVSSTGPIFELQKTAAVTFLRIAGQAAAAAGQSTSAHRTAVEQDVEVLEEFEKSS